jgi:hypothetical protein
MKRLLVVLIAAVVLIGAAAAAVGLRTGSGDVAGTVAVTVTREFGAQRVAHEDDAHAKSGDTVMRLLQRDFDVRTRYGGGFVQEIDGIAGGREDGRPVDWFYYVNGIEAPLGAAARKVYPGDRIWWDHHDWTATMHIPAVVGSFPEPFTTGTEGRKLPVRLVCLGKADHACDEVETRLDDAGVTTVGRAILPQSAGKESLRVLVGPWSQVRQDTAARKLESGPAASGVYAKPDPSGDRFDLLDEHGATVRTLGHGGGLVAATQVTGQQATWVVTGTDATGVEAAAAAVTEDELRDHFAVAIDEGRTVPLPISSTPENSG